MAAPRMPSSSKLTGPFWVYDIWSAYSHHHVDGRLPLDDIRLSEELALAQLAHIDRMKRQGVRFDAYMMNAYWHDPDGGYRSWSRRDWPNGPDRWIAGCHERGLKPGLWFGTNWQARLRTPAAWADSLADFDRENPHKLVFFSLFEGGFLADFMAVLQHWYDRGIRIFELDYANFRVATPAGWATLTAEEIHERNKAAL
ncbi:MAG TPA: hypothetical protein VFO35_10155, partial [Steroidobacteraceae bacterium]|nr:hypothetical protein [Steroidobacteraceae bacterium]